MNEEKTKKDISSDENIEEIEPTTSLTDSLDEDDEDEQQPEEKSLDHIKGVFNYLDDNDKEYRVVFYIDRKNLIFRELGNGKVDFVGRFTDESYDHDDEKEMREIGERELKRILTERLT